MLQTKATHAVDQYTSTIPPGSFDEPARSRDEVSQGIISVVSDIRQVEAGVSPCTLSLSCTTHTLIHPSLAAAPRVLLMGPYIGSQSGGQLIKLSPTLTTCVTPMALSMPALPACSLESAFPSRLLQQDHSQIAQV